MRHALSHPLVFPRALFILPGLLSGSDPASAAQTILSWDAVPGASGYKLYYGTHSRDYGITPLAVTAQADATTATAAPLDPGQTYYFAVTAYDANGGESPYSNEVSATLPGTVASFSVNPPSALGSTGTPFTFQDTSVGNIVQRAWALGDGATASTASVSKNYAAPGTYTVTLKVTASDGGSGTAQRTITVASPSTAAFSAAPTSGTAPLTVRFSDASTGATAWNWQFGDGTGSMERNPQHTYQPGTYTVTLQTSGPVGRVATLTKTGYIQVAAPSGNSGGGGLVAAYGFDETSGATAADASGQGNPGAVTGATWTAAGHYGGALSFNGANNWVTVGDSPSLDLNGTLTLEAWVYPATAMSGSKTVAVKANGGGKVYWLRANNISGHPEGGIQQSGGPLRTEGTSPLSPQQWSHLAMTYDGAQETLYVNGQAVSTQTLSGPILTSGGALLIGGQPGGGYGAFFQGILDELRIYNRALSPAEIARDAKTPIASPVPAPLLGDNALFDLSDSDPQGEAEAFQTVAKQTGTLGTLRLYLDAGSTATDLVAGVYDDQGGHPGRLLAQGRLNTPQAGAWNTVALPAAQVGAGRPYWIAVLGVQGDLAFRVSPSTTIPMESCADTGLNALPEAWTTGRVWPNGKMAAYVVGR